MQTESNTNQRRTFARFPLGGTYITPGAEEALMLAGQTGIEFLRRHMSGDFGDLSDEDAQENELSIREGFRVFSAYLTAKGQKLDHHRSQSKLNNYSASSRILIRHKQRGASASRTRAIPHGQPSLFRTHDIIPADRDFRRHH